MITVTRGAFGPAAAQVLEQVRAGGTVTREEIAGRTGLSLATVRRAVSALAEPGLLRERADLAQPGAGRPGIPVEVDPTTYAVIGLHIGRRLSTVAIGDLTGRVLAHDALRREAGTPPDLDMLSRVSARLLGSLPGRAPLAAGLVGAWRDLEIDADREATQLHDLTGLDVRTGDHISSIAATEFLHRRHGTPGVTLYVYARDMIGFAVVVDKGAQTEVSRTGSLTHFPAGSGAACPCGRSGCLEVTVGDEAVATAAHGAGLVRSAGIDAVYAAAGNPAVRRLLEERARALGRTAAIVRDMVAPDRVVLVGQAFTGFPDILDRITSAFEETTALGPVPLSFTRFGGGIQAMSACTIALGPVYDDPLALAPAQRATPGQTIA